LPPIACSGGQFEYQRITIRIVAVNRRCRSAWLKVVLAYWSKVFNGIIEFFEMDEASRRYFRAGRINTMVRRYLGLAKDRAGSAAIEFAIVAPLLCTMLLGMIQFAFIFNNISVLTNATATGALLFSQGRSFTSPYSSAVSAVKSAVKSAAGSLTTANLTITTSVNGTACTSDAACLTAFGQGGIPATVTVSYPCPLLFSTGTLQWLGINTSKMCPLSSTMTAVVQ
jgi:Flp pilus assembly protein TadG